MPDDVILNDISVDGTPATVLVEDGHFTTVLDGRGRHEVAVSFQVPIIAGEGPPRAHLRVPRIPVSRFELRLPGRKDVLVSPGGEVALSEEAGETLATVFTPMSEDVIFSWREAVPEALRGQVRTNASLYHTVLAEEGVLHARIGRAQRAECVEPVEWDEMIAIKLTSAVACAQRCGWCIL